MLFWGCELNWPPIFQSSRAFFPTFGFAKGLGILTDCILIVLGERERGREREGERERERERQGGGKSFFLLVKRRPQLQILSGIWNRSLASKKSTCGVALTNGSNSTISSLSFPTSSRLCVAKMKEKSRTVKVTDLGAAGAEHFGHISYDVIF